MISYIRGSLAETEPDRVVLETGGVGLEILVPVSVLERLPAIGQEVKLFTYFQVREDAMVLFGFLSRSDRKLFEQLLGVKGIGPKGALSVMSSMTPDMLRTAILSGDARQIARAPGIGSKTAQLMILEMKDKISEEDLLAGLGSGPETSPALSGTAGGLTGAAKDAVDALVALGYSASEASKAVRQIPDADNMDSEQMLKAALRYLF